MAKWSMRPRTAQVAIRKHLATRRGRRTWHVQKLLVREPGGPAFDRRLRTWPRSASGRRGAVADDARRREVRLCHSSWEADEQSWATGCGVGGAKGGGQGECEPAQHVPGAGPGKRVTGAGAHTTNRKATEEGTVHVALPFQAGDHSARSGDGAANGHRVPSTSAAGASPRAC